MKYALQEVEAIIKEDGEKEDRHLEKVGSYSNF
jgi:hypothetical protein